MFNNVQICSKSRSINIFNSMMLNRARVFPDYISNAWVFGVERLDEQRWQGS